MIRFSARYYDGTSSHSEPVTVSLEGDTLRIEGLAAPLSHAMSAVKIAPRLGNTTRSLALPEGAKCETSDNAAVDELERATGRGRGSALLHRLESQWRLAIAAAVVLSLTIVAGVKWGIPLLAERIAKSVPDAMAYDLGRGTLAILDRSLFKPSELSAERKRELQAGFENMARGYADLPLKLRFRRGIGPNAFALPDGTVIVTDELTELASDDRQILGVLAHEIGHVHHRHTLRMALESSSVMLIVTTYLGDVAQVTTLSAALPAVYAEAHYSRTHETEADAFALQYLKDNGIPARHFADMLRALQKWQGPEPEGALEYMSSHPSTAERIRRLETPGQ